MKPHSIFLFFYMTNFTKHDTFHLCRTQTVKFSSFLWLNNFSLCVCNLAYLFLLILPVLWLPFKKSLSGSMYKCFFPMFATRNFIIYAHTFKTIYFEFNFVNDVRSESSFIILLVDIVFPIPFIK